jgi:hypothetical protein
MTPYKSLIALLCAATLAGCGDNAVQSITAPASGARIKFFNFGVNAPGVNFYANSTKMTAISSANGVESATGVTYSNVGNGGLYDQLPPGSYTLTGKIAATADNNVAISTVASSLEDGKFYSYYQSGFYNTTTKTVDAFVVEDPIIPTFDYSVAYVRFVNAISNSVPMTLYANNTNTSTEGPVGGLVAYKGAGAFTASPVGVYDLNTRVAGSTANTISRAAATFVAGRVYTITARGDYTVGGTTATNRVARDQAFNR